MSSTLNGMTVEVDNWMKEVGIVCISRITCSPVFTEGIFAKEDYIKKKKKK